MIRRVLDLLTVHPDAAGFELEYAPPHTTWQSAPAYIQVSRVTGNIENPRFGRPNPTWDDHANIEIWAQGFGTDSEEAAERAEEAMSAVLAVVSENRLLALHDSRLDGVQTSNFTELDGPMFLGTDQGVISSYRAILHVHTLVRTNYEQ